jgi:hypothetical protein
VSPYKRTWQRSPRGCGKLACGEVVRICVGARKVQGRLWSLRVVAPGDERKLATVHAGDRSTPQRGARGTFERLDLARAARVSL